MGFNILIEDGLRGYLDLCKNQDDFIPFNFIY